jgi:hypothetical protein
MFKNKRTTVLFGSSAFNIFQHLWKIQPLDGTGALLGRWGAVASSANG